MNSILIIDDDPETIEFLETVLTRRKYQVLSAQTGAEGVELARTHHPTLALVDISMPDMNGYEVCRRLRADPGTRDIAIMILTARNSLADQTTGIEAGADMFVVKPIGVARLLESIERLLGSCGSDDQPSKGGLQ
jgi:DNA-binding response OmpR family regulator